jgi:ATP-binding cassette, subfamily B, bacterial
VALARAFLKDAPILLLDEATSSLDAEAEQAIRETLERLMRGRTVVAITHRLSTVARFDRILVIQSGELVQDGQPADLATHPGPYRDLLRAGARKTRADAA